MHPRQLCRLIHESLRPFSYLLDQVAPCLTKESEKDLLIVLSQVFRQIQLWIDSDSDNGGKSSGGSMPHCDDHDCLTKIVGELILMLPMRSQYVQHLSGNILVGISDYMIASGNSWDEFMQSLCVFLELAISNALLHSLEWPTTKAMVSNYDSSSVIVALKPKLKYVNWSSVACIIRVLRNILKNLKQDLDGQLLKVYMDSISSCFGNVPWDSMDGLHVDQNGKALRAFSGDGFHNKTVQLESMVMFHGTLVQFFCSVVNQSGRMEAGGGSLNKHPVICEISDLIPGLLAWCLGDGDQDMHMSEYFRHKILMLMVRLSFQIHLECSLLLSWLQLIHKYFDDLLLLPMTQPQSDQEGILEGSPFLASVSDDRVHNATSRHLQRLAVFIFLRCSFTLVGLRDGTAKQCGCANPKTCMNCDVNSDLICCSKKKGLSELYWWLQGHLPADMFVSREFYSERCTSFCLSFLRLFIHEDDVLFEVLLELFCVHFCARQQDCQGRHALQEMKDDILFHVSNIFNPIHLFHLFLSELHYDHQVLLDCLISKDTGASSAEYLLRSLRAVCDSWNVFVEFSVEGKIKNLRETYMSSAKKIKVLVDGSGFQGYLTSSSVKSNEIRPSLEKQCQEDLICGIKHCRTTRLPFENAKDCLLSLKKSVQNLHQKNLFPYNPEVLLRRLMRFQELCLEQ